MTTVTTDHGAHHYLSGDHMGLVAEVGGVHPIRQLGHPGHQLGRDLNVTSLDLVESSDPEPGLDLEQGELLLGQRPDGAGDEGALGQATVELRQKLRVCFTNLSPPGC